MPLEWANAWATLFGTGVEPSDPELTERLTHITAS
jgi:hypothetical protein